MTYLEKRHIDDVSISNISLSFLHEINRSQDTLRLFSNRSQMTSKCGENTSDTPSCPSCNFFCSNHTFPSPLINLINSRMATSNLNLIELFHGLKINLFLMKINFDFVKKDKRTTTRKRAERLEEEQIKERTDLLYFVGRTSWVRGELVWGKLVKGRSLQILCSIIQFMKK